MRLLATFLLASLLYAAPTIQTVCASGCTTANLQTAINTAAAANSGPQIIVLTAGENFDTATGFFLPGRTGSYTGWITIRSSRISELPSKTRVAPADTAKLATLRLSTKTASVLTTSGHPSAYWRLEGLEFTLTTTGLFHEGWLVGIGYGTDSLETEPSKVSHHIVLDRCYIHGLPFDNGPRDGIRPNGNNVEILNSYISEIKLDNQETHGILGYNFNGPLLVRNTFVGGAAIGSLIGGAPHTNVSIQPNSVQFLGNHFQGTPTHRALRYAGDPQGTAAPSGTGQAQTYWKTDTSELYVYATGAWRVLASGITGNVCTDGDFWENTAGPTYYICSGGEWTTTLGGEPVTNRTITGYDSRYPIFTHFWSKNKFELKTGTGVLVEGNIMADCFAPNDQNQTCGGFLFNWGGNQDGNWNTIREVQAQNNLLRRVFQMTGEGVLSDARTPYFSHRKARQIDLKNNLYLGYDLRIATAINNRNYYNYPPVGIYGGTVGGIQHSNSTISHNTIINPLASSTFWPVTGFIYTEWSGVVGKNINDNLFEVGGMSYVASTSGTGGGAGCITFTSPRWWNYNFKKNVMVQTGQNATTTSDTLYDTEDCGTWAWPWKRSGTGVYAAVSSASIADGYLRINFGANNGSGLLQGTKIKLAGWTPAGLDGTYTIPRLGGAATTACTSLILTQQVYQQYLCLPTAVTGTVTPGTIEASVDYTDWAAGNYRLAASSVYTGWATDGSNPGVNQDAVEWATAATESGADNPYLDFRVRGITPTADGATFRYTAYSNAACTWTASATRAHAGGLGSWGSETRIGRDGAITVTMLDPNTTYWYRVTCDTTYTRDGEFTTTH